MQCSSIIVHNLNNLYVKKKDGNYLLTIQKSLCRLELVIFYNVKRIIEWQVDTQVEVVNIHRNFDMCVTFLTRKYLNDVRKYRILRVKSCLSNCNCVEIKLLCFDMKMRNGNLLQAISIVFLNKIFMRRNENSLFRVLHLEKYTHSWIWSFSLFNPHYSFQRSFHSLFFIMLCFFSILFSFSFSKNERKTINLHIFFSFR